MSSRHNTATATANEIEVEALHDGFVRQSAPNELDDRPLASAKEADDRDHARRGERQEQAQPGEEEDEDADVPPIPRWPFVCLVLQHTLNSWAERSYEFGAYLYLIVLFPSTLVPASLLGLLISATSLVGSGWVGGLVDYKRRLPFVRWSLFIQKSLLSLCYALFIVLFQPLKQAASSAWTSSSPTPSAIPVSSGSASRTEHALVYLCLALIIVASSIAGLVNGGLNVAIQRDWVVSIAQGSSKNLTALNTWLRRIDLLCKLLAPLFVSLLTTSASYSFALYFLLAFTFLSLSIELVWIGVVWRAFPILAGEETLRLARLSSARAQASDQQATLSTRLAVFREGLAQFARDVAEFVRLPVFLSSLAIALVYLTTLSFDGVMLSYLKSQRGFSDPFIAGMRGVGVVMGLLGTVLFPWIERTLGLVRGGAWAVWSEVACLLPPLLTLFIGLGKMIPPGNGPSWNSALFFSFIALSRIGLWSFDLVQLQTLQISLASHPRRNRLTALQLSLQSAFDLAKYGLTLGFSSPAEFRWTALVSFVACAAAGCVWTGYVRVERGHLIHWDWLAGGREEAEARERAAIEEDGVEMGGMAAAGKGRKGGMRGRRPAVEEREA